MEDMDLFLAAGSESCFVDSSEENNLVDAQFEAACSGLLTDLSTRKRTHISKYHNISRIKKAKLMSCSPDRLEDYQLVIQHEKSTKMPQMQLVLNNFIDDLKRRKKWKHSYLAGSFRENEMGEIEPIETPKEKSENSLFQENLTLKKNLALHEKSLKDLARQQTQIFNTKDKEIALLKLQLKG